MQVCEEYKAGVCARFQRDETGVIKLAAYANGVVGTEEVFEGRGWSAGVPEERNYVKMYRSKTSKSRSQQRQIMLRATVTLINHEISVSNLPCFVFLYDVREPLYRRCDAVGVSSTGIGHSIGHLLHYDLRRCWASNEFSNCEVIDNVNGVAVVVWNESFTGNRPRGRVPTRVYIYVDQQTNRACIMMVEQNSNLALTNLWIRCLKARSTKRIV